MNWDESLKFLFVCFKSQFSKKFLSTCSLLLKSVILSVHQGILKTLRATMDNEAWKNFFLKILPLTYFRREGNQRILFLLFENIMYDRTGELVLKTQRFYMTD